MPAMLQALLLCREIIEEDIASERGSERALVLVHPVSNMRLNLEHGPMDPPYFYARVLVDVPGDHVVTVDLIDPRGAVVDTAVSDPLPAPDPIIPIAYYGRFIPSVDRPGRYEIRLSVDGAYVAHIPMVVVEGDA